MVFYKRATRQHLSVASEYFLVLIQLNSRVPLSHSTEGEPKRAYTESFWVLFPGRVIM